MSRLVTPDSGSGLLLRVLQAHPLWWLTALSIGARLLLFVGRGDYVAFDEGWYLLLGRNLLAGDGYTLSGLRHIVLSPLFPIIAGVVDSVIRDAVWAGRLVAAVTGGLLVVPCWFLFRRIGGRRAALLACILIAVMPSLAPFVVPYWIGWDLWVGAEPLAHLLVYAALAVSLRAVSRSHPTDWALAGLTFGLGYLARPEAVITFGFVLLGVTAMAALKPRRQRLAHALLLGLGFCAAAAPYWVYLHDVTGRWMITGRAVALVPHVPAIRDRAATPAPRPVEDMLWRDDDEYAHRLYALDPGGERLANSYWGVPDSSLTVTPPPVVQPAGDAVAPIVSAPPRGEAPAAVPGKVALFARAMGIVIPLYLWPLVAVGVLAPRRRAVWPELLAAAPVAGTAVAIAAVVAVDPRTQLILVPLALYYAARGIRQTGSFLHRRLSRLGSIRRGIITAGLAVAVTAALIATDAHRLYMSLVFGSPHHLVGAENRRVGEALRPHVAAAQPVMSWHPAIALYARRDWRVLPHAPFDRIVRYANAVACEYLVLSTYYPSPLSLDQLPREYLVLHVPPGAAGAGGWGIHMAPDPGPYVYGELQPRESGE